MQKLNINSAQLFKLLFIFVFWGMWLAFPFLISVDNEGLRKYMIKMIPINLSLIPLFFINTEILINKVLTKKGIGYYVSALLIMMAIFLIAHVILKPILVEGSNRHSWDWFRTFLSILTVTAVSTGYGLINYFIKQENLKKEEFEERKKSEVSFLRSQISPHFIFNTLNSIVYLIRSKSPNAEDVTIKLSEIMQFMLYNSNENFIPLEKELKYLNNYIELQKIRFGEDIHIDYSQKGEPFGLVIEPMLIIPFVENAFKHGTGALIEPYIGIEIEILNKILKLKVKNKHEVNKETNGDKHGIGLVNVKRRLDLLYPKKHLLKIESNDEFYLVDLEITLTP